MAPEVYAGEEYGFSVDTYSLGLVLYRMLNKNRGPFLPQPPEAITFSSREQALARRMSGEPLPRPFYGEGRLGEIVLKACAFDPKDRYSSPSSCGGSWKPSCTPRQTQPSSTPTATS
ncbi:MAG: hypothetical protein ACLR8L_07075 [Oscillospiraceae bacterium]